MPVVLGAGNDLLEFQSLIDMALVVRGNKEKLIEKPFVATIVSIFMMKLPNFVLDQIRLGAEYGVPMLMSTTPIAGISGPVTIPGNSFYGLVTTLTGIILAQLIKPGTPCVEFLWSLYMDQATGKVYGIPENYLGEKFRMGIAKELLGIPVFDGTTCASNSLSFNQDAIFELSYHFSESYKGVADGYLGLGDIETGMVFSPHALIFSNELIGIAKRENEKIEINEITLPIELIKEVKGGVYGAEVHTVENMNTSLWRGKYFHLNKIDPKLDIFDRMDLAYSEIMKKAKVDKIDKKKEKEIMRIASEI
jgi:trimethylamine---corrinoid protein Co-methyltransferase